MVLVVRWMVSIDGHSQYTYLLIRLNGLGGGFLRKSVHVGVFTAVGSTVVGIRLPPCTN